MLKIMALPGFTAKNSVQRTGVKYYTGRSSFISLKTKKIVPQQVGGGWDCMPGCLKSTGDWAICEFYCDISIFY